MIKQKIHSPEAPAAIGTYSQAIRHNNTIYFSGQIPLDPVTMNVVSADFEAQTRQVFANMQAVCMESGVTLDDIAKLTVYLTDINKAAIVNDIMRDYFREPYPARTTIQVVALPKAVQIEVDAIVIKN